MQAEVYGRERQVLPVEFTYVNLIIVNHLRHGNYLVGGRYEEHHRCTRGEDASQSPRGRRAETQGSSSLFPAHCTGQVCGYHTPDLAQLHTNLTSYKFTRSLAPDLSQFNPELVTT
jgi:hypothetical protein